MFFILLNLRLTKPFFNDKITVIWGISSAGRAPGSQSGGQGFDPPMLHHVGMDFAPFRFFVTQKISHTLRHSSSFAKRACRDVVGANRVRPFADVLIFYQSNNTKKHAGLISVPRVKFN